MSDVCGIVGCIGRGAVDVVLEGLRRLEYRGYDSVGFGAVTEDGLVVFKDTLRIEEFIKKYEKDSTRRSELAIGHTRWATHGVVSQTNAHPHLDCDGGIAVVHNGIIENHHQLRSRLLASGHRLRSDTDSELVAHLIEEKRKEHGLFEAVRLAVKELVGSYALCVISSGSNEMVLARMMSPLVIGIGDGAVYAASDIVALLEHTRRFIFLENGDVAVLRTDSVRIVRAENGEVVDHRVETVSWSVEDAEKEGYEHFMLKEIYEQPHALQRTLGSLIDGVNYSFREADRVNRLLEGIRRVAFVACGTAYHACLVGSYLLRDLTEFDYSCEVASEFRYSPPPIDERTLVIAVSQSGETADTLAAVRIAKRKGARILAVCNVQTSSLVRTADETLFTLAGPEIGVASTKAYTSQLGVLYALFAHISGDKGAELRKELLGLSVRLNEALHNSEDVLDTIAERFCRSPTFLYIGRRYNLATAYEGALKLKEISYIHAEGYGAGEMKHGPIALVQSDYPTVAVAVHDSVYEKMLVNIEEIKARRGPVIAITSEGDERMSEIADYIIGIPEVTEPLYPVVCVVPLQLLAYRIAVLRGCDVDKPRNLAKSVTVE